MHLVCFYSRAKRLSKVKLRNEMHSQNSLSTSLFSEKCLVTLPAAYSGPSTVRKCVSGYIPIGQVRLLHQTTVSMAHRSFEK